MACGTPVPRRPHFSLALCITTAVFLAGASGPARAQMRFDEPQIKINWIDVSKAPEVTIYASFLDRRLRPVPLKVVRSIEVGALPVGEDAPAVKQATPIKVFTDGVPPRGEDGELLVASKAGLANDVVVVAAGFQDPALRQGTLGEGLRAAVDLVLKKAGDKANVNVIWYNDRLFSYFELEGKANELSDIGYALADCRAKRLRWLENWGEEPEPPKEGEPKGPPPYPCGLLSDAAKVAKILKRQDFRGFYPRLMGFGAAPLCADPAFKPLGAETGALRQREPDYGSAIDEGFKMLVRTSDVRKPKYLILLSDGREQYIYRQDDCRLKAEFEVRQAIQKVENDCRALGGGRREVNACLRDTKKIEELRKKLTAQGQKRLDDDLIREQKQFQLNRLRQWLTLADAANIRVFAVGLPLGQDHERERLKVLAFRSGGTYREVVDVTTVVDMATQMMEEIGGQYVVRFDAGLEGGKSYRYELRAKLARGGNMRSEPYDFTVPTTAKGGLGLKIRKLVRWLEKKVGSPWHILIIVGVCLLVSFILFIVFWKLIKFIRKKVKEAKKKAEARAKAAAAAAAKGAVPRGR